MQSASHRGEKVRRGLVLGHNITAQPSPGKSRGSIWESSEPDAGEQSPRARCELGGGRECSPDVGVGILKLAFPLRSGSLITAWPSLSRMRYHTSRKLEARRCQTVSGRVVGFCPVVELSMNDLELCEMSSSVENRSAAPTRGRLERPPSSQPAGSITPELGLDLVTDDALY